MRLGSMGSRRGMGVLSLLLALVWGLPVQALGLPEGFTRTRVAGGITGATAMAIAADGRVFVCEQTGALRVVKEGALLPDPFLAVEVDSYWERGLIGVCLDPGFPEVPHLYVAYVAPQPYPHHRVSRFTARGDRAAPGSEVILLEGDDQRSLGGSIFAGHQGGAVHFGKDGKLYIAIGEQTAGAPSQKLDTFQGKLLRIEPDGSIPSDNPFLDRTAGKYRSIWARGLRNPFAFAVEPASGRIFVNDVGGGAWEEINEAFPGANYGWPRSEGPTTGEGERGPVHAYDHSSGKSITGGVFYFAARRQFPARYHGRYFFADFDGNWIKALDPERPRSAEDFATGLERPVDLQVGPDGSLYCLNRNAWVKDDKFQPGTGSLDRIAYTGEKDAAPVPPVPPGPEGLPLSLSATGIFRSLSTLEPGPGLVPYDVNSPLWSDGALKRRWISLPGEARISFFEKGEWAFPAGTLLVKHFELPLEESGRGRTRRIETRLLVVRAVGGYGATYRWRQDGTDADLLSDRLGEAIPVSAPAGPRTRSWYYPGPSDCLTCHTPNAGFVLGVNTRQLNRPFLYPSSGVTDNQLRAWSRLEMFQTRLEEERVPGYDRLSAISDAAAPLEHRLRSYLDSNCAQCHRPGGARGLLDARFDALRLGDLVGGPLETGDLGIAGARNVVPRDLARSILHQRMARLDVYKMPPLAMNEPDEVALSAFAEWINGL